MIRSRSRWNTGRIGSCSSGLTRPRLASLNVAQGAKVSRSISSVRCRTSIRNPHFLFLPLLSHGAADPHAASAASIAHPPCRRGKDFVLERIKFLDLAATRQTFPQGSLCHNGRQSAFRSEWSVERLRYTHLCATPGQLPELLQQGRLRTLRHLPAQGDTVCELRVCKLCPRRLDEQRRPLVE